MSGALIEAEQIAFCWRLFGELGLRDKVELEVNGLAVLQPVDSVIVKP